MGWLPWTMDIPSGLWMGYFWNFTIKIVGIFIGIPFGNLTVSYGKSAFEPAPSARHGPFCMSLCQITKGCRLSIIFLVKIATILWWDLSRSRCSMAFTRTMPTRSFRRRSFSEFPEVAGFFWGAKSYKHIQDQQHWWIKTMNMYR